MPIDSSMVRRLSVDLRQIGPKSVKLSRVAIQKACADTKRDAQVFAPVDTGNLRSSIGYKISVTAFGASGEVGPTAAYGIYQEFGTSTQPGIAFMRPAFDRNAPTLARLLAKIGDLS